MFIGRVEAFLVKSIYSFFGGVSIFMMASHFVQIFFKSSFNKVEAEKLVEHDSKYAFLRVHFHVELAYTNEHDNEVDYV